MLTYILEWNEYMNSCTGRETNEMPAIVSVLVTSNVFNYNSSDLNLAERDI
jgi:hypothetical protein